MWFRIICLQSSLGKHKFKRFPRERLLLENLLESKILFLTERKGLCKCKGNTDPAKAPKNIRLDCVSSDITFICDIFGKIRRYGILHPKARIACYRLVALPLWPFSWSGLAPLPTHNVDLNAMKKYSPFHRHELNSGLGHTEEVGLLLFPYFPTPQVSKALSSLPEGPALCGWLELAQQE